MLVPRFVIGVVAVSVMAGGARALFGQDYPNKPIRIVASGAGGSADFTARLVAQEISGAFAQPVIVENRADAQAFASRASPDGYTLLVSTAILWIGPLMQKTSYDVSYFSPITLISKEPNVLVVHPSLPVKSVKELIALAKAKPGALNYAIGGVGGTAHLAGELFKSMAGVNMVNIPYSSGSVRIADLRSGQTQVMIDGAGTLMPLVKSGALRILAVTSAEPSALLPGVPTVAEYLSGYESVGGTGMFAPAKTPETVVKRLNQEIVRVLNRADAKEKLLNMGIEAVGSSPEQLAAKMKSEMVRMGKVIKDAGIRIE